MRLLQSQFSTPGPLVMASTPHLIPPGIEPLIGSDGRTAGRGEVLYPRHINGRTVVAPLRADQIPRGWQTITARQPMRLAECWEVDCRNLRNGWTRVLTPDGNTHPMEGEFTEDQAVATYGPRTAVLPQPPGTPCYIVHKIPTGIPPIYQVNGRWVMWNEFEDSVGGGVHQIQKISKEGRYG